MKAKSNSGWKGQSLRHSNARKHGRAGGTYSTNDSVGMKFETEKELNDYMKGKNTSQKLTPKELSYAKKLISKADRLQLAELREETTEANIKRTNNTSMADLKKENEQYVRKHENNVEERKKYYVNDGNDTLQFDDKRKAYDYYNDRKEKAKDKRFVTIRSKKYLLKTK